MSTPTRAALAHLDRSPATIDFMPSAESSPRRAAGSIVPIPPSMMPRLPKFAKPQSA